MYSIYHVTKGNFSLKERDHKHWIRREIWKQLSSLKLHSICISKCVDVLFIFFFYVVLFCFVPLWSDPSLLVQSIQQLYVTTWMQLLSAYLVSNFRYPSRKLKLSDILSKVTHNWKLSRERQENEMVCISFHFCSFLLLRFLVVCDE